MSYDDARYIDRQTMAGNCDVDTTGSYPATDEVVDAPAPQPAGTKFISQGEVAISRVANRARYQLALNCDILKEPLDSMIAVTKVEALTGFAGGSSLTVNPLGGGASDVEFGVPGYLYVGNGTDYSPTQESYDTLFQILDAEYNEVLVGGQEVKITAAAPVGAQPGNGFYNTGVVTLTLNPPLPAGDYRFAYARDSSLAALPDDALIRADIRGLHEAAGESGLKGAYVLDPSATPSRPADFFGPTCLQDALASLSSGDVTLFLRSGTYTLEAAGGGGDFSMAGVDDTTIVGESMTGTIIEYVATRGATMGGADRCAFRNLSILQNAADTDKQWRITGSGNTFTNVIFSNLRVRVSGAGNRFEGCIMGGSYDALDLESGADQTVVRSCTLVSGNDDQSQPILSIVGSSWGMFEDTSILSFADQVGLYMSTSGGHSFNNCRFTTQLAHAFSFNTSFVSADFRRCSFSSESHQIVGPVNSGEVSSAEFAFYSCDFSDNGGSTFNDTPVLELLGQAPGDGFGTDRAGHSMRDCVIRISEHTGDTQIAGTGDTITQDTPDGTQAQLVDSAGVFKSWMVGSFITIAGSGLGNDGQWRINRVIDANTIYYNNSGATTESTTFTWTVTGCPMVLLEGVVAERITITHAATTYHQLGEVLRLKRSFIQGLTVTFEAAPSDPSPFFTGDGAIHVGENSRVVDLTADIGQAISGPWYQSLLYLRGRGVYAHLTDNVWEKANEAIVDGVRVIQDDALDITPWTSDFGYANNKEVVGFHPPVGALATVSLGSTLRRVMWDAANLVDCPYFIHMNDGWSSVEDCQMEFTYSASTPTHVQALAAVIMVDNAVKYQRVQRNQIVVADGVMAVASGVVYIRDDASLYGVVSDNDILQGNEPQSGGPHPIFLDANAANFWRIHDNMVVMEQTAGIAGHDVGIRVDGAGKHSISNNTLRAVAGVTPIIDFTSWAPPAAGDSNIYILGT